METFGDRLKTLRTNRKMTQAQLAIAIKTDEKTISKYEHNKRIPSPDGNLKKIAELFGVKSDWLLTGKGYRNKTEELREQAKQDEHLQIASKLVEKYQLRFKMEKEIEYLYDIENVPQLKEGISLATVHDIDYAELSPDEWDVLMSAAQAKCDLFESIFNYMETVTNKFKERYGAL